jgi:hypothetical protein
VRRKLEDAPNDFWTAFSAPDLETFREKLTEARRVTLEAERECLVRSPEIDRLRARSSRPAIWRDRSLASLSARSRVDSVSTIAFRAFVVVEFPVKNFRFFGEL